MGCRNVLTLKSVLNGTMIVMIKAIVFDCFGVVVTDALSALCAEIEPTQPDVVRQIKSLIHAANRGIIAPADSTNQVSQLLDITVDEYRARIVAGEQRNQLLLDYIVGLRDRYKTGMLTNVTVDGLNRRFPDNELARYFDEVVVSSAIGYAKPDPEAYQIVAERLGLQPQECIFTDDRQGYCDAAGSVGMQAILFDNFAKFKKDLATMLEKS